MTTSVVQAKAASNKNRVPGLIVFTASASGCPKPLYEFWIQSPGATAYTLAQAYSRKSTWTWNTAGNGPGPYTVNVWVRDASSSGASANASGGWDSYDAHLVCNLS